MVDINRLVIPVGHRGATGDPGINGIDFTPPPDTINTYGRGPGYWSVVYQSAATPTNSSHYLVGGISFGSATVAASDDVSRHISLGGSSASTSAGLSVTPSTLNLVGIERFSTSPSATPSNSLDNIGSASLMFWAAHSGLGIGNPMPMLNGMQADGEIWVAGVGVRPNISGYTNGISWRWDGRILVRIDQALEYATVNACDERLKQDIELNDKFDALGVIRKIRLYQYRWKKRRQDHKTIPIKTIPIGFSVQKLKEDYPEGANLYEKKQSKALSLGNADPNTILATLCRAVQQLDKRVEKLSND